MSETIFECRTKATNREDGRLRFSFNWATARETTLQLTTEELLCGDWRIPYAEIEDAVLVSVPTILGVARNLNVTWRGRVYQFQIKSESAWRIVTHPFWDGRLPFPVGREVQKIERMQLRLLLLVGLIGLALSAYWVYLRR